MKITKSSALFAVIFFNLFASHEEFTPRVAEVSFIQLSYDGVNTFQTGVGSVVRQTNQILQELNKDFHDTFHAKLYLMSPDYSNSSKEFSLEVLKRNVLECASSGGDVFLLPKQKKEDHFGDPKDWSLSCNRAVEICKEIIEKSPYTIIIEHDSAFAHTIRNGFFPPYEPPI